jgi:hypothetical protein
METQQAPVDMDSEPATKRLADATTTVKEEFPDVRFNLKDGPDDTRTLRMVGPGRAAAEARLRQVADLDELGVETHLGRTVTKGAKDGKDPGDWGSPNAESEDPAERQKAKLLELGKLSEDMFGIKDKEEQARMFAKGEKLLAEIEELKASVGDSDVSPRKLLADAGDDWVGAKDMYAQPEHVAKMWALVFYRKKVVDDLVKQTRADLGAKYKDEALGSVNLGSDYDLSLDGGLDAEGVALFNKKFAAKFGDKDAGQVFDTNLYTRGEFLPEKRKPTDSETGVALKPGSKKSPLTERLPIKSGEIQEEDDDSQDALALAKVRSHMDEKQWLEFSTKMLDKLPEGSEEHARAQEALHGANRLYSDHESRLEEEVDRLKKAHPDAEEKGLDLVLKASNNLYAGELGEVAKLKARRERLLSDASTSSDDLDDINHRIRAAQGKALLFANEAYFSEGALRHVVGNMQAGMEMELTQQQAMSSFNENFGDALKDLHHYREEGFGKAAYRSSKYVGRLLDAARELGAHVDLGELPHVAALQATTDQLLLIRGDKAPYKGMSSQEKDDLARRIMWANGISDQDELDAMVLELALAVNHGARRRAPDVS